MLRWKFLFCVIVAFLLFAYGMVKMVKDSIKCEDRGGQSINGFCVKSDALLNIK